jgi:Ca2+-binding RTX toxin-like protein
MALNSPRPSFRIALAGDESPTGTADADTLDGAPGNDTIAGLAGNDLLLGGEGGDWIDGGEGNDSIDGGDHNDTLYGDVGDDTLTGGGGMDVLYGGDGYDTLYADGLVADGFGNTLYGGTGHDTLVGGGSSDALYGEDDNDSLTGGAGVDTLDGGAGSDLLYGGDGDDALAGGIGNDSLYADAGNDTLDGGDGDDTLLLAGADRVLATGGLGADRFVSTWAGIGALAAPLRITDFVGADGDLLDFGVVGGSVNGFTLLWRGMAAEGFTAADGQSVALAGDDPGDPYVTQLWTTYDAVLGRTVLYADSNRDGFVDYGDLHIEFDGIVELDPTMFAAGTLVAVAGTAGDDDDTTIALTSGNDLAYGLAGNDTLHAFDGLDTLWGGDGADALYGGGGADHLRGGNGGDLLAGEDGDDILEGGDGADTLYGGAGNDSINTARQTDNAETAGLQNLAYGGDGNDTLLGGNGTDRLHGEVGNDYLYGYSGNDSLDGGNDADTLGGGDGNDTLIGGAGDDVINSGTGADFVNGGAGNDRLIVTEASGARVTGGIGTDTFDFDGVVVYGASVAAPVRITDFDAANETIVLSTHSNLFGVPLLWRGTAAGAFTGTLGQSMALAGTASGGYDVWTFYDAGLGRTVLFMDRNRDGIVDASDARIEIDGMQALSSSNVLVATAQLGTVGNDTGTTPALGAGNDSAFALAGNDTLDGLAGDDFLSGDNGNDSLSGGAGVDTLSGGDGTDWLFTGADGGQAWGGSGNDTLRGGDGADALHTDNTGMYPTGYDSATTTNFAYGGGGLDALYGAAGVDRLYGEGGSDTLQGGAGNDSLDGGLDNDSLLGETGNDVLQGGAGMDWLVGGTGSDTVHGGDGTDYIYGGVQNAWETAENPGDVNALYGDGGSDQIRGGLQNDLIDAGIDNDYVNADAGNDTLSGGDGDDRLEGGAGDDTVDGGAGIDAAAYEQATAGVTVSLLVTTAQATGSAGSDVLIGIENLYGSSFADWLTGNAGVNWLVGGNGDDTLNGGAGGDSLFGGYGSDSFFIDSVSDVVYEDLGPGIDLVNSFLASTVLGDNVENLRLLSTGAANGSGNALDNTIFAGAGNNGLNGGTGVDTASYLYAASGVTVSLASTAAQATGGSGSDTLANFENLTGSHYADNLRGNALANRIDGGIGADWILGGGGADVLVGGAGADVFVWTTAGESTLAAMDAVADFNHLQADRLDMSRIDADAVTAGDQAFVFIGSAAFSADATAQLRYEGGVVYGSVDADSDAEFAIALTGAPALLAGDFVL